MKDIKELIKKEEERQKKTINLIASENIVSKNVLSALGSVFTNKYAEGYPGKRYYGGNKIVDEVEKICQREALEVFIHQSSERLKWYVNVQPYSGSPANLAVYLALVPVGGKIMSMDLVMGGHLSHAQKVSLTGRLWKQIPYGVERKTEMINYEEILKLAKRERPKLIIAGFTAYSRKIDFKKFREIANLTGAYLMADISHIAGLIAAGLHQSPFPYADIITTTTHKTLRGPRSAMIFCKKELAQQIDKAVFPGLQGGPHINQIAATAVALKEARSPAFKKYIQQVIKNAKVLSNELRKKGWRIVSGGTDNHLFLVDTMSRGLGGREAAEKLEDAGIIVNKNMIPFDRRTPSDPSGIRIGTPFVTSQGMKEREMFKIAEKIDTTLSK